MAVKPQIKANQLAKDLNIKSKEIVDIMASRGIELKAQKALEPHEFNVLFDALTAAYQIEGIDDYIDGITTIPSKLEKKPEKEENAKQETVAEDKSAQTKENTEEAKKPTEAPAEKLQKNEKAPAPEKKEEIKKEDSQKPVAAKTEIKATPTETPVDKKPAPAPVKTQLKVGKAILLFCGKEKRWILKEEQGKITGFITRLCYTGSTISRSVRKGERAPQK